VTQVVALPSVYAVFAGISGVLTGGLAISVYRRSTRTSPDESRYPDLVWPFLVVLVVFTLSAFVYAIAAVNGPPQIGYAALTFFAIVVPWTVFALRQSGRGFLLTRLRIGALLLTEVPTVLFLFVLTAPDFSTDSIPPPVNSAATFLSLVPLGFAFLAAGLLLLATYRHGSITLGSGVVVVILLVTLLLPAQVTRSGTPAFNATLVSVSYLVFAMTAVVAVVRYDVLSIRPGTGTLGERAVVKEMSEPVLVVGPQGTIGRSNEIGQELFGDDIDGEQLREVLGCSVTELANRETLERWTEQGRVRFDPRVSPLTRGDRTLGYAVTLIDVTDRELRKQRIQVLNRILRHNIRNDLDVVKARAEATIADEQPTQEQVDKILQVADDLERLSADARRIQKLIQQSDGNTTCLDLAKVVHAVVETVESDQDVVATAESDQSLVTVDVPSISVQVDETLLQFALRNIVENAIEHNDTPEPRVAVRAETTETGLTVTVVDDGPGVPPSEWDVIESESERPLAHATSIGLWGTNWAVQTLGGELSYDESDLGGAAVTIDIPSKAVVSD
jgi:signal transduction histidine kinase